MRIRRTRDNDGGKEREEGRGGRAWGRERQGEEGREKERIGKREVRDPEGGEKRENKLFSKPRELLDSVSSLLGF